MRSGPRSRLGQMTPERALHVLLFEAHEHPDSLPGLTIDLVLRAVEFRTSELIAKGVFPRLTSEVCDNLGKPLIRKPHDFQHEVPPA